MSDNNQKPENLIQTLCDDLCEVKVMCHPIRRALPWCLYAILYIFFVVYWLGFRSDMGLKMSDPAYVYELSIVLAMSISAACCSIWLCIPDMRGQKWMLAVPVTLFIALAYWLFLKIGMDGFNLPHVRWFHCHAESLLMGAVPAITIWFLSMRGKTTHPYLMTAMNVLAVGGLGYIGLRMTCSADDMGHISFFHILPYAVCGGIAGLLSRRLFRW